MTAHWPYFYLVTYKKHCNNSAEGDTWRIFFSRSFHSFLIEREVKMFWHVPSCPCLWPYLPKSTSSSLRHVLALLSSPCKVSHLTTLSAFLRRKSWTSMKRQMAKENRSNPPSCVGSSLAQPKSSNTLNAENLYPLLNYVKWSLSALSRSVQCSELSTGDNVTFSPLLKHIFRYSRVWRLHFQRQKAFLLRSIAFQWITENSLVLNFWGWFLP